MLGDRGSNEWSNPVPLLPFQNESDQSGPQCVAVTVDASTVLLGGDGERQTLEECGPNEIELTGDAAPAHWAERILSRSRGCTATFRPTVVPGDASDARLQF